jgi:hypothetical protein
MLQFNWLKIFALDRHIFKRSKIAPLCISIETVKVAFFFLSGVEIFQILGVEVSTGICHD